MFAPAQEGKIPRLGLYLHTPAGQKHTVGENNGFKTGLKEE